MYDWGKKFGNVYNFTLGSRHNHHTVDWIFCFGNHDFSILLPLGQSVDPFQTKGTQNEGALGCIANSIQIDEFGTGKPEVLLQW